MEQALTKITGLFGSIEVISGLVKNYEKYIMKNFPSQKVKILKTVLHIFNFILFNRKIIMMLNLLMVTSTHWKPWWKWCGPMLLVSLQEIMDSSIDITLRLLLLKGSQREKDITFLWQKLEGEYLIVGNIMGEKG